MPSGPRNRSVRSLDSHPSFERRDLTGAFLFEANLTGAFLALAILTRANLTRATMPNPQLVIFFYKRFVIIPPLWIRTPSDY